MLKPRIGDLARLKPREIRRVNGAGDIECYVGGMNVLVYDNEVEEILPRPLAVDDRVRFVDACGDGNILTILAVDGEEAWVKWPDGVRNGQLLSVLRRIG